MIAGAEIDAKYHLLPDLVTGGTLLCGFLAALMLNPQAPLANVGTAAARSLALALIIGLLRWLYGYVRGFEGLGLGDVKLSAGIGAWLPVDLIALCFCIATMGALLVVVLGRLWGNTTNVRTTKIPLGAFLCPALWLVFYLFELRESYPL
jgi:leader peptidase (prepilin peptidase)/N-methyltransferase